MRVSRKMEHVVHALRLGQSGKHGLDDIHFVHNCIPETSLGSISLETSIGELALSSPIIINAMTGGAPETSEINRGLAIAAAETGVAMAVGSQMSALKDPAMRFSYEIVRKMNPNGMIFANLGSEATPQQAQEAVEMIEADALQIHLNVMQELIMPEGDRCFTGMRDRISAIVQAVEVPVIVKEVGFGIMRESSAKLRSVGVSIVDVGGSGGTNFAAIENARRPIPMEWLDHWGNKLSAALIEALQVYPYGTVIASGGIRNALDICKSLTLGASAAGIAGEFLRILHEEGISSLIQKIEEMKHHLKLLMTALGASTINELTQVPIVIGGATAEWCNARGIAVEAYAARDFPG
jgi:isopentenyl-diphosphate delta-isomerase